MSCTNIGPGHARLTFAEYNTIVGHESQIISVPCDLFLEGKEAQYRVLCTHYTLVNTILNDGQHISPNFASLHTLQYSCKNMTLYSLIIVKKQVDIF